MIGSSVLPEREQLPWRDGRSMATVPITRIEQELNAIEAEIKRRNDARLIASAPARLRASIPPKLHPFFRPSRNKGAHGGRGSAKSQTFGRLLLLRCLDNPGTRWVCVREIQLSLEQSVKRLLKDLIEEFSLEQHGFRVLESRIETPGGGVLVFQGMQNHTASSIKSLEGFDGAWVEEAQTLSSRSLELLRPTIREEGSELWFSWNPEKASDPVDKLLRSAPPADSIVIEVNWQDNPHFPSVLAVEKDGDYARDPENAAHVWGGKYKRRSKATVFKNWRVERFDTPSDAAFLFGGDWGFAVDPTVLLRAFSPRDRVLCIDREVYEVGCEIEDTPALFDTIDPERPGMARAWEIVADSARPETISHLRKHGYPRIIGARKGPGSIEEGIKFLQGWEIIVHPRCTHVVDEFTDYSYKVHPLTGEVMPVLLDKKNHTIDSARYLVEKLRLNTGGVVW